MTGAHTATRRPVAVATACVRSSPSVCPLREQRTTGFKSSRARPFAEGDAGDTFSLAVGLSRNVEATTEQLDGLVDIAAELPIGPLQHRTISATGALGFVPGYVWPDGAFGLSDGSDTVRSGRGDDTVTGGNGLDLVNAGGGDDTVNTGKGADAALGGNGDDELSGGSDNDSLQGGSGNDRMVGGTNRDTCAGQTGIDIAQSCEVVSGVP